MTRDHRIARTADPDAPRGTPTDAGDVRVPPGTAIPCGSDPATAAGGQQVGSGAALMQAWARLLDAPAAAKPAPNPHDELGRRIATAAREALERDMGINDRGPDLRAQARDAALREAEDRIATVARGWGGGAYTYESGVHHGLVKAVDILRRLREGRA